MADPTACWHRYLVAISALWPDEDEATQALIELVQWLRVRGRPPDGMMPCGAAFYARSRA